MVVDALDLCYSKQHIDMFSLLTGDSDFSPLVSKLKENNKRVIGCGVKNSTSNLLIANCDEFIYYDDLVRAAEKPQQRRDAKPRGKAAQSDKGEEEAPKPSEDEQKRSEAMDQLMQIVRSLILDYDPLWGSMVKQTIRRVYPSFNEAYFGYQNFAELLKDAQSRGYLDIQYDQNRGNYKVFVRDD
jgi:hypothetical protein